MRIAITVDPNIPVPPRLYGGIERMAGLLVEGLVERGHRVTILAHPDSDAPATLVPYGRPPHFGWHPRLTELYQVGAALWRRRRDFDVVHSFGRLAALLPILPLRRLPKIQTYHRPQVPWSGVRKATLLAGESVMFTACSDSVWKADRLRNNILAGTWSTVYNAVDVRRYELAPSVPSDAPLVYLGKIEPNKGVHHAIAIAKRTERRLVIAGNRSTRGADADYFAQEVAPHLDNNRICYIGEVNDEQKNSLLKGASCLLFPTQWKEAFGLVMIEAMACGTPVIAWPNGAVPEVVRDGENGFLCDSVDAAIRAIPHIVSLDRTRIRRDCEVRFSSTIMVDRYEAIYEHLLGRQSTGRSILETNAIRSS